ncbi:MULTISPECIES: beta-ketoacyl-ACP synthase [Methylobacterium]|jgi:3-oxoacyl-[acyl-carrier-protein] synthase II|uniref:beta-ketoacyl-ACP synthase n=1 Tax=Methylobacterium TaxID=407 RepID=UPI0008F06F72|nr:MULTISPECIES: beta-ketoacyl-ACP synthase [Methylobacterium]MBK3399014.1 beta-ketoacyl-ACP synthase [Methylobacterium ajmalii]MBK3411536.1 beta-ketoacyl-ACP synthase [Methylobacterium ajmalii]MBZ6416378.1 beta-ketoacyl-ACP synthase [Methylobacterium sp.]SFF78878.1 3-oxoacyl-[acyl-carrier-protein] synthase II [Methylobacterium sp. yr596]
MTAVPTRPVVVTGLGLVSCAGEGVEAHLAAYRSAQAPRTDATTFAPYPVHPVAPLSLDGQISKKSDQRQMEPWQRLGVYAAGLALDAAGAKADAALKSAMHLVVAAGGGERDYAVDGQILTGLRQAADPGAYLNERLQNDLRPTLFLAQLSNLLAGNIAIVHGVTGASRTFMGEESSGVDALRIAQARIAAGQLDIVLVGGSYNAERADVLLIHEMGGHLSKPEYRPVFERAAAPGFILGSGAAFLVLEAADHAAARGARALARLDAVASDRTKRRDGSVTDSLTDLWGRAGLARPDAVISAATGCAGITGEERDALTALAPQAPVRALGDLTGHTLEAAAPFGAALAAALVAAGEAREVAVTAVGHRRGEGVLRLTTAGDSR